MAMSQKDRDTLRSKRVLLVQNVIVNEELLSSLQASNILLDDMKEEIEGKKTRSSKVGFLLDVIVKRGKTAFEEFIKALVITNQEHLAKELDVNLTNHHIQLRDTDGDDGDGHMEVDSGDGDSTQKEKSLAEKVQDIRDNTEVLISCRSVVKAGISTYISDRNKNKVYDVSSPCRGRAIIISWEYYSVSELGERIGNKQDVENLENLFMQLHFKVVKISNETDKETYKLLDQERTHPDHASSNMLIVCLLSHGTDGHVFALNGAQIKIEKVISYFEGDNCPSLKGKPKLFFIQACQVRSPTAVSNSAGATDGNGDCDSVDGPAVPTVAEKLDTLVHEKADILVARATTSGYVANRHEVYGSLYIRCLVYVFSHQAHKDHVLDMLTEVASIMTQFKTVNNDVQLPEKKDTFTKKLYFMPGYLGPD
jgi:hypothetical protein